MTTMTHTPHPALEHETTTALAVMILALPPKESSIQVVLDWIDTCGTHLDSDQFDRVWRATAGLGREGARIRNALREALRKIDPDRYGAPLD